MRQLIVITSIIMLLLVIIGLGYLAYQGRVSRDQAPLGLLQGSLAPCSTKPNAVCSDGQTDQAHFIAPISIAVEDMTFVAQQVEALGGRIVTLDADYLAAEFSSDIFGFVDDLELLRDPLAKVIHVRAAARVGHSDMGVNRKRVEALRQRLERAE